MITVKLTVLEIAALLAATQDVKSVPAILSARRELLRTLTTPGYKDPSVAVANRTTRKQLRKVK